jgi:hypothetical protein
MSSTDWYSRSLLTLIAGLLLLVATELHWTNRLQAAANNLASQPALRPAAGYSAAPAVFTPVSLGPQPPAGTVQDVRIVGYAFDGEDKSFGTRYGQVPGLPVRVAK